MNSNIWFPNLHLDGGYLRILTQGSTCNEMSHGLKEILRRTLHNISNNPAPQSDNYLDWIYTELPKGGLTDLGKNKRTMI